MATGTIERTEAIANEDIAAAESECAVGSEALVDEDDGKKGRSFGRLIGAVYCNGNNVSLNEILLDEGKAVLYEDFYNVSMFANEDWIASSGC